MRLWSPPGAGWLTFDGGGLKAYGGGIEAGTGAGVGAEVGGVEIEDVIEAVMDDDVELGNQLDVQGTDGEVFLVPKQPERNMPEMLSWVSWRIQTMMND